MNHLDEIYKNFWYFKEKEKGIVATDSDIKKVEQYWGVDLPKEFIDLLKICDGGIPILNVADYDGEQYTISVVFSATNKKYLTTLIPRKEYNGEEDGIPKKVVLFAISGNSWYGFDYRKSKEPTILCYDEYSDKQFEISKNFKSLLLGLKSKV